MKKDLKFWMILAVIAIINISIYLAVFCIFEVLLNGDINIYHYLFLWGTFLLVLPINLEKKINKLRNLDIKKYSIVKINFILVIIIFLTRNNISDFASFLGFVTISLIYFDLRE